ncbi:MULTISPECIES: Mrp/NBP35 family ATP-binding protein [Paracoccus]|jgi:ATP-binding protein involved in chromosome partitioning|uniref:Iron-sulfur cluster carrier protein n=1 Tax=Paracoccus litorisediminis TaxID=2006130 RepID=A0A844HJH8_9RHOB|nr:MULTISPECIES: Mrp/NBP35 family ATP-binding protein [Paracoccus]MBD9525924.1 Mrp/NBP35 family ATP-binding protein [Paracoccus sp. PAR01]MTH58375.1 P-loop NTPase [Paracoccus litorisediminis]
MTISRERVLSELQQIAVPGGGNLVSADLVRALSIENGTVRFVIEAADADAARAMAPVEAEAERRLRAIPGVEKVQIVMTAPAGPRRAPPAGAEVVARSGQGEPPPSLKIGRHPTPQAGPAPVSGVARILAIGSGKGGVGKSTLTSNLAVALARAGRRVGLLDADIYGPSQPRMLGLTGQRPTSEGDMIQPLHAHGVTVMSLGLMMKEGEAVVWRGPMLMGALQQMLGQVNWGELDVLLVDLPPGTGDVQLTLCQKAQVSGAIIVSTPQDVALIDARRAIDMFNKLKTPVLGLVENMSTYICPNCGHEAHLFGHGGVAAEAQQLGLPFLGEIPLNLEVRLAGDGGTPIAATDGPVSDAFTRLAQRLIGGGMA